MFTGIVETTGDVTDVRDEEGGRRIVVECDLEGLTRGASIAVDGACLTVEAVRETGFELFCSTETLDRTTLSEIEAGTTVNLERALPADGRLDGHFVQGHVDATAEVVGVEQVGDDWAFEFSVPESIARYVVEKGSIALDGVSLTVAERREGTITVAVIPTTYELTTMHDLEPGDGVNVEVDVIAKYVERLLDGHR
ncbi:riboflavin synthase [Halococcus hamelinensis]|uniref:Riboflavin synthase n=1 Tax=Halococcus hamelinensis 100A6 TaxID=1132509 RepID=M0LQF0_9EURY|nr:riboflavin synthase [Halococcus hamelinensis]EMA35706.1 riboflavin synthase subunit alpha [Halococcus hamelinensis 100A6]